MSEFTQNRRRNHPLHQNIETSHINKVKAPQHLKRGERTSSAVFHFASWPKRFCPAQTLVCTILRKSCPVRGLNTKMAPLMGFVVRFPSKVLWIVTR